jgi:hypothetical protein
MIAALVVFGRRSQKLFVAKRPHGYPDSRTLATQRTPHTFYLVPEIVTEMLTVWRTDQMRCTNERLRTCR